MDRSIELLLEIKNELHENNKQTTVILEAVDYLKKKVCDHGDRLKILEEESLLVNHTYKMAKLGIGTLIAIGSFVMGLVSYIIGK